MPQSVYTLLCHRDMQMAFVTLPKIIEFLVPSQQLYVIDDGSLTLEDIDNIKDLSPMLHVITRREREDYIIDLLRNKPHCRKYREQFPFAFKLLDVPLIAKNSSPRFTYTDSDIIYLKNSSDYFNQQVNTFLRTDAIKLSFKLRDGLLKHHWTIPFKFNAGYLSFNTSDYDLDFIEYYLGLPNVFNIPWVSEQACWALLFGRAGKSYCPLENQFVCRENFEGPKSETLAIHLIGNLKSKVQEWAVPQFPQTSHSSKPVFEQSRNVTLLDWAQKSARRFFPSL